MAPLNFRVNKNTIVRFFFLPANDYFHPSLIFRVVTEKDPRLNTAPIANLGGRTPYVTLTEMLIQKLAQADLSWYESDRVEVPKRIRPREITDKVQVRIFFANGTDWTLFDPKKICKTLAPVDSALKQPRALWEFQ
jgi:hypothetical protein